MKSLSVIILSYMEIQNIRNAYQSVISALEDAEIYDYEIILVTTTGPDGTDDGTSYLADRIAARDSRAVRIHGKYHNRAEAFIAGLTIAQKEYVTWVPGDNVITRESLAATFARIGTVDLVIAHTVNSYIRPVLRRIFSWSLVRICNLLFGLEVKYYSGICVFPRKKLQELPLSDDPIGFMVEGIVYFLKSGASYTHVPQYIRPTKGSSIGNLKSIFVSFGTLFSLFWKVQIRHKIISLNQN